MRIPPSHVAVERTGADTASYKWPVSTFAFWSCHMEPITTDAPASRITTRAQQQLLHVASDEQMDLSAAYLRVAVVPGGCSGLTYDLGWDTAQQPGDVLTEIGDLRVVMDLNTSLYIDGTELDFTDGLDGQGFHFLNPQATRTCACGESFGV